MVEPKVRQLSSCAANILQGVNIFHVFVVAIGFARHEDTPPAAAKHPGVQRSHVHAAHLDPGGSVLLPGRCRCGKPL